MANFISMWRKWWRKKNSTQSRPCICQQSKCKIAFRIQKPGLVQSCTLYFVVKMWLFCYRTMPGVYKGPCKRGVFALSSWEIPLKRPQCWLEEKKGTVAFHSALSLMQTNCNRQLGKHIGIKIENLFIHNQ